MTHVCERDSLVVASVFGISFWRRRQLIWMSFYWETPTHTHAHKKREMTAYFMGIQPDKEICLVEFVGLLKDLFVFITAERDRKQWEGEDWCDLVQTLCYVSGSN